MKDMLKNNKLIIITGPTAVGKTALSVKLAKKINGEIISADSMQVYKYMDIGSAKVTPDEMDGVKHYLIDVLDPREDFNVCIFKNMAQKAISDITSQGKIPILVGGTGFYIQALLYDIDFDNEEVSYKEELTEYLLKNGEDALFELLRSVDPKSCELIPKQNTKRVIRAIEFYKNHNFPISEHNEEQRQKKSDYDFGYFCLYCDRTLMYERIDKRVDIMIENGLVEEVKSLKNMGLSRENVSMQGLGYKEILDYLDGSCSLDEAVDTIKRDTRHFAKRQMTWFRRERDVTYIERKYDDSEEDAIIENIIKTMKL